MNAKRKVDTFVLMPYGANGEYANGVDEAEYVYREIIYPGICHAAQGQDWEPTIKREMDRTRAGSVTSSLVTSLIGSEIVIVDITGRNPNVFFELGIRYALRDKITILLAHEATNVPFDIRGYRYIPYSPYRPQLVRDRIKEFILEGMTRERYSDSLVFEVFPTLSVSIPNVLESKGQEIRWEQRQMPWSDYMDRVYFHCRYLKDAIQDGRFVPHALIGITNGGLVTTDIIGKAVLAPSDIPVLALWASRFSTPKDVQFYYFDNQYNNAMTKSLSDIVRQTQQKTRIKIILIDDHMGTGQTSVQAIKYLEQQLDPVQVIFIPLVSRRAKSVKALVADYFPYSIKDEHGNKIFDVSESQFIEKLDTAHDLFPYVDKAINKSTTGTD